MRLPCAILIPLSFFVLAGCQTGDIKAVLPIAGGETINVLMGPKGPPPGEADGYQAAIGNVIPGAQDREVNYEFGLVANREPELSRIQVDDVSDDKAVSLIDDRNPKFTMRHWSAKTETIGADDPRMKWVYSITSSFRVYRYTLTHADGHTVSFYHVTMYPPFIKAAIRAKFGEKY